MKTINKFLGKEKKPDSGVKDTRAEAMTLEEMAVKVQERKILGSERKVDMSIIMFVALCLCGLIIINVVLYFLIGESKSNTLNPVPITQDARGLLKERREERAASLASADTSIETAIERVVEEPLIEEAVIEEVLIEEPLENIDTNSVQVDSLNELSEPETNALEQSTTIENVDAPSGAPKIVNSDPVPASAEPVIEETQEEIKEPSATPYPIENDIPFDVVISVGSTINDWAGAWSAQDVDKYLSYYADSFVSEAGMNIQEWRAHRAIRLTKPEWISIGIDKLKINVIDGGAKAEFIQEYNASNYSDKELKKMIFKKVNDEWTIFDERATPVN